MLICSTLLCFLSIPSDSYFVYLLAFAKRVTILRFVMSVCPLATRDDSTPTGRIIVKWYVGRFLIQFVDTFEFSLKSAKIPLYCDGVGY